MLFTGEDVREHDYIDGNATKVKEKLTIGQSVIFFCEKERKGTYDGNYIRDENGMPWGVLGILYDGSGWIKTEDTI